MIVTCIPVCVCVYTILLQESWIQHATVRDNILFGKEFKADKYEKVIQACALQQVIAIKHTNGPILIMLQHKF